MSTPVVSIADVEMRSSTKGPLVDVASDSNPALLSALSQMLDCKLDGLKREMDLGLDTKLDTKFDGWERRMDQVLGLHQVRLDKHDTELQAQR